MKPAEGISSILVVSLLLLSSAMASMAGTVAEPSVVTHQLKATSISRILIPHQALVTRFGIPGVFVMHKGLARFRMVKTGATTNGKTVVLSGLFGNERLVLSDLDRMYDGRPVIPGGD